MQTLSFLITPEDAALRRLDKVLLARLGARTTRALLSDAFSAGRILQDGRRARKADAPRAGARVEARDIAEVADRAVAPEPEAPLTVVYEDARLVAVDKPAGQACQPAALGETGTLAAALLARYPELAGVGDDPRMPGLLHRLDQGTSGLVLAARDAAAFRAVRAQFSAHTARKIYLARVEGRVEKPGGVSGYLAHASSFRGRMRPVEASGGGDGNPALFAETFYRPCTEEKGNFPGTTLLEVTIRTGVTHQIRCQLAAAGFPIVGDVLYGAKPVPGFSGHLLHAAAIRFSHPQDQRDLTLRTPTLPPWAASYRP